MTNQIDVLAIAREAGFSLDCDWPARSDYLCDECDILKFASAILERAAVEFDQPHMEYFGCNIQDTIRALKPQLES